MSHERRSPPGMEGEIQTSGQDEQGSQEPTDTRAARDRSAAARLAKVAQVLLILGLIIGVVALALLQLRTKGTRVASGISVADFKAQAKVDERPAPPFEMPALDGTGSISLQDFSGKVVVLNFWASWCGPCRKEAPGLQRTWEAYRARGVQFLGVNYRDDRAAARAYEGEFGITYPSVYDPAGKLAFDYRLLGLPTTFVIDREGRITYRFVGYTDGRLLSSTLDDVLGQTGG